MGNDDNGYVWGKVRERQRQKNIQEYKNKFLKNINKRQKKKKCK